MSISNQDKASVLIEALPYIQKYTGQTVVIKYGGNAMLSEELQDAVISDLVLLSLTGIHVVLVHGGGPDINDMLKKIGKKSEFINGLRYTDENGVGKPMERSHIKVTVAGGRLIGLGSACPFYPESYLDFTTDTYYGEALAVVLPEDDMTITADDDRHHAEIRLPIA